MSDRTEYIERGALLQDIEENVLFTVRGGTETPTPEMRGARKVIGRIEAAPTINSDDLRPQGRWTETNWTEHDGHGEAITRYEITVLRCSNCCCCFKKEALWRRDGRKGE